jgi:hypothetical protein
MWIPALKVVKVRLVVGPGTVKCILAGLRGQALDLT